MQMSCFVVCSIVVHFLTPDLGTALRDILLDSALMSEASLEEAAARIACLRAAMRVSGLRLPLETLREKATVDTEM